jgi:hypothetical protein
MSWAEFRIRLFAFNRIERNRLELYRLHAYHTASGGLYAMNPKKFPKSLNKFWKLPSDNEIDIESWKATAELLESERKQIGKNGKVRS